MILSRTAVGFMFCVVPVAGPLVRHFDPPICEKCAGHRGVTLKTVSGDAVVATADGVVEFAGSVGGRIYVVQRISPSVRVTYGWLTSFSAAEGASVVAGEVLGLAADHTYLSVRVGDVHVEPLRALGLGRSRLVPSP